MFEGYSVSFLHSECYQTVYQSFRLQYLSSSKVKCHLCTSGTPYQPKIGDQILISPEKHSHTWPLTCMVETFPSEEDLIPTVELSDGAQHLLRDPRQLLPLECDDPEAAVEPQLSDPTEPTHRRSTTNTNSSPRCVSSTSSSST